MSVVIDEIRAWLRPYQLAWLSDTSRNRVAVKSRQIGWSSVCIALEAVLASAGLHPTMYAADCNIVSKRDEEAKDVIRHAKAWVQVLRCDPDLEPFLRTTEAGWSASRIEFERSGCRIRAETQNPDAARGKTGHLYLDEFAAYRYQREIWTGATPSTESDPRLRITVVSTPRGTRDLFHELWTDTQFFPDSQWSRHSVDIYQAVDQGMPVDIERIRRKYTADQFAQEFECKFLGDEDTYFPLVLLQEATRPRESAEQGVSVFLGVDTASVRDTTACVLGLKQGDALWLHHAYILPNLPYQTDHVRQRIGQDAVVDALVRYHRPSVTNVDRTGDAGRELYLGAGLYALLSKMQLPTALLGQKISKEWKDTWVSKMKQGLASGPVRFDEARKDLVFSPREAAQFLDNGRVPDASVDEFVATCFQESPFPLMRTDFQKVYRKWLGPNDTTFDTERDGTGHGDSFWAAVLCLAASGGNPLVDRETDRILSKLSDDEPSAFGSGVAQPEYMDFI